MLDANRSKLEFAVKSPFFILAMAALLIGASMARADSGPISGIQAADMDKTVRPQDDLFQYANGTWLKNVPIPPDRASYGVDSMMTEHSLLQQRDLIEAAQTSSDPEVRKVSDLYSSYMNEAQVERLGIKPLRAELQLAAGIKRRHDIGPLMGYLDRIGIASPLAGIRAAGFQALRAIRVLDHAKRLGTARPRLLFERRCAPGRISYQVPRARREDAALIGRRRSGKRGR